MNRERVVLAAGGVKGDGEGFRVQGSGRMGKKRI
jgi:hypothetical protein